MTRTRVLAVIAALTLVAAACGGDDDAVDTPTTAAAQTTTAATATSTTATAGSPGSDAGALADVRAALDRSQTATSGRFEGSLTMVGVEGAPADVEVTVPFGGAFDTVAEASSMAMDMSGFAAAAGEDIPPGFDDLLSEMEVLTFGDVAYLKFPFFTMMFGIDTEWLKLTADDAGAATGAFGAPTPSSPNTVLSLLLGADAVVAEVGRETLRGVETTRYSMVVDSAALLERATPEEQAELEGQGIQPDDELPIDLWIGDDGLVYRYTMEIDGAAATGGDFERLTMSFEFYDYGAAIDLAEPDPSEVTDAGELGFDF